MVGVRRWERVKYNPQDGNGHYTGFLLYLAPIINHFLLAS